MKYGGSLRCFPEPTLSIVHSTSSDEPCRRPAVYIDRVSCRLRETMKNFAHLFSPFLLPAWSIILISHALEAPPSSFNRGWKSRFLDR